MVSGLVTLFTKPVISHEMDRGVFTTIDNYVNLIVRGSTNDTYNEFVSILINL